MNRGVILMIKPINDFDGYYISDNGDVYCNLGKGNRNKNKTVDMYKIKPRLCKNGYLRVYMRQTSTNKRVDRYIHRLVAENFIHKPEGMNIVNHLDTNRQNNNYHNLEWTNHKGNNSYSMILGHLKRDKLGRFCS